ncbi:MAG TPA: TolC family protein [Methylomirabilota bacterium]|jgi:cobalt-zinc-cadmium efflux system outer membrane protein|nr:TolC family protein [Methylomirabilota bacterium]
MARFATSLVLTVLLVVTGAVPARAQLTLVEAVRLALLNNPTLAAKERETAGVRAGEITAGLRPNPTASYAAEQLGASGVEPQHTVALSQTLETGGKRRRRIESARGATRVSELELADVQRLLVAQVKKAFTDLLVAGGTVRLATENLQTLDEVERVNRVRAEKGDIAEVELLRIQVQRFAFERDLVDARQAVQAARAALRAAVGARGLADDFVVEGDLAFRDVPLDRERVLQASIERRADVRAADAGRGKARADLELARANAWWDVAPQVQYQRIGSDNTFGLGVSIPIRVFDRNQGEIARAGAEITRADQLRQAAIDQARSEIETALALVASEREKVLRLGGEYVLRAQRIRETVQFAYRRGALSVLDLLDAERTYRETTLEHLRALGNYWNAVYQLEAAAGGSLEP